MLKIIKYLIIIFSFSVSNSFSNENFFIEAKNLYEKGKIKESKFLFQRNIVFNPKDSKSYLYLAKIYESEENEIEEEKNINTTLLLEPNNEEAIYMLIDIKLEKSDISKVKELKKKFEIVCSTLCSKIDSIDKRLNNIDVENES
jgi:tetratricopeptide (TPR) repeat protein|tara:strand:+ start:354 stop:785 length:432 start_codon:yes stop_codon:yes gene_type:complete